jgi:hypothetical protein
MAGFLDILKLVTPYVSAGGQIAGAVGSGRAASRAAGNAATLSQDEAAQQRYRTEQAAKLGAAQLTESATQDRADRYLTSGKDRAQQVGLGDLLANVRDVEIGGLPSYIPKISVSGGLRPSALGPMTRQAGGNLARQALEAQMSGSDIPNLPDVSGLGTDAPQLSELEKPGALDKVLELGGYAGLPFSVFEEKQRREREEARVQREEARKKVLEAQQLAQYTAPTQLPTDLRRTGLFGG